MIVDAVMRQLAAESITGPPEDSVTPGLLGFLVIFAVALATWLLMRNLTARLRRLKFREDQRLAAEAAPADEAPAAAEERPQ